MISQHENITFMFSICWFQHYVEFIWCLWVNLSNSRFQSCFSGSINWNIFYLLLHHLSIYVCLLKSDFRVWAVFVFKNCISWTSNDGWKHGFCRFEVNTYFLNGDSVMLQKLKEFICFMSLLCLSSSPTSHYPMMMLPSGQAVPVLPGPVQMPSVINVRQTTV